MKSGRQKTKRKEFLNGSQNQQRNQELHRSDVFRTVTAAVHFFCLCLRGGGGHLFLLKPYVGTETVSWMCILGAAPFAALGFIKYNGMTAEKFIYAWIKSEFLMPKKLTFRSTNTYYELFKPSIEAKAKEAMKSND